jgi:TolB-like protein/Tfp pilus assembly protein PilF
MAQKLNSFDRFWKELKRRKVVHVITVYAAIAFGILQLVDIISPSLHWPDWTMKFVIVLLCIGFIISVFVSWIYDITPAGVKKTKPVSEIKHSDQTTAPTSSGWKIVTYISAIIIVALVAFNFISRRNLNADILKLDKSIAVLPFLNESPVDSNKYFINGIMEEVLTNLQKIKDFRVLSRTSTDQYKGQDRPTIPEIAKKLNVNYVVEGSGQKYGNTFILRVQLIKGKGKENHLWAKSFEQEIKEVKDYIKIQSQIAQAIAAELKAVITPEEKQLIEKVPTGDVTAYDFYQRGNDEYLNFWLDNNNNEALIKAERFYRKAINYDPTFAQAYAGLAIVYLNKYYANVNIYFSNNYLDSTLINANHALSYDEHLADAYFAKGGYYFLNGNTEQTLQEFDKALKYNKNYWQVYAMRAEYVYRFDFNNENSVKAIEDLRTATTLNRGNELPGLIRDLGDIFSDAGFYEKALDHYKEALNLDNDSIKYFLRLAYLENFYGNYAKSIDFYNKCFAADSDNVEVIKALGENNMNFKRYKEALKYYNKSIDLSKTKGQLIINWYHRIGYTYWQNGLRKEAAVFFKKQREICEESIKMKRAYATVWLSAYYDLAGILAFTGEKEKAYENLRIFNKRPVFSKWFLTLITDDPLFDKIRNETEFQQIVKDLGGKYQAEHDRVAKWLEEQGILK